MPLRIVEGLEIIQVDEHHCAVFSGARADGHALQQALVQQTAIGQFCEQVVKGQTVNFFLGLFAHGDVLHHEQHQVFFTYPGLRYIGKIGMRAAFICTFKPEIAAMHSAFQYLGDSFIQCRDIEKFTRRLALPCFVLGQAEHAQHRIVDQTNFA